MKVVSNFTEDELTLTLLTEYSHYLGIKTYLNFGFTFLSLIVLLSEANYFMNHMLGMKPTFVRVFQVISGSVAPSSVGLTDERLVRQLLRRAKWLPLIQKNNNYLMPVMTGFFVLGFYLLSMDIDRALVMGTYPAIINALWGYYTFNIIIIQLFLFYILCKFFVVKIKAQNQVLQTNKNFSSKKILNILHSYDAIYREIEEYNTTYWSKFLFTIWVFFGVVLVVVIYLILFAPIPSTIKILCSYFTIILIILYLFIMTTASSVNSEANKSYDLLNFFAAQYFQSRKAGHHINVVTVMKVCF